MILTVCWEDGWKVIQLVSKMSAANYYCLLTGDTSRPAAIDEWLPEGAVRLADDLGFGGRVVVMLEELAFWAMVLQGCAHCDCRVAI